MYKSNFLFPILVMLSLFHQVEASDCDFASVEKGVADFRCWDGKTKKSLKGTWDLSYQSTDGTESFEGVAQVPQRWNDMSPPLPFLGRGEYHVKILLEKPINHLGLQLTRSNTARKIILIDSNGMKQVLFDSGMTDLSQRSVVNMRMPVIDLPELGLSSELIVIHNNTESVHGGVEDEMFIGPVVEIIRQDQVLKTIAVTISTILAAFFVLNISLWIARGQDWTLFVLGGFALSLSLRQLVVSGVIYDFFPSLSTTVDGLLGWGTFFASFVFGELYYRGSYPKLIPWWVPLTGIFATSVGIILLLFYPLHIVQSYGIYFRPFVLLSLLMMTAYLIYGLRKPDKELRITLLSAMVVVLGSGADTTYFHLVEYYSVISLSSIAVLIFVGVQTVLMSQRYWSSLTQSAMLAQELKVMNVQLEEKVDERTAELAIKNQELESLAKTDQLTGLPNRRAFEEKVAEEHARTRRSGSPLIIGIIDLDYFKAVNDNYGHDVGDQVLVGTADLLLSSARSIDFPARWGGEEFVFLFPNTSEYQALTTAERLRELIENTEYQIGSDVVNVTASIGLARVQSNDTVETSIKEADLALYKAKQSGRNCTCTSWVSGPNVVPIK